MRAASGRGTVGGLQESQIAHGQSLRAASGDDPVYIAEQLGHEDPTFTISVYAKAVKRRERLSDEYRAAFDRALEWAEIGRIDAEARERVERVGRAEAANPAP